MNNIIDARGLLCPKPIILTKKALNDNTVKDAFVVLIDNETSKENVERFLSDNKVDFNTDKKDNVFSISVSKVKGKIINSNAEDFCTIPVNKPDSGKHVICIKNNKMGFGSDELGEILIQAFINTIKEVEPLPEKIVFYNKGVIFCLENSKVLSSLKELENLGVKIIVCGTCVDYFKVKPQVAVGIISNMYEISQTLTSAAKVVCP